MQPQLEIGGSDIDLRPAIEGRYLHNSERSPKPPISFQKETPAASATAARRANGDGLALIVLTVFNIDSAPTARSDEQFTKLGRPSFDPRFH